MKWSFAGIGVFMLGIFGVAIIILFQNVTTNNENDYYLLKEITEAAMIDSIDLSYYRETGNLKIVREKFVENFTRRYGESTIFVTNDYKIKFYDIMEEPPKVTVIIDAGLGEYTLFADTQSYSVQNYLSGILENKGKVTEETYEEEYYYFTNNQKSVSPINIPSELNRGGIKNVELDKVSYLSNNNIVTSQEELMKAILKSRFDWPNLDLDTLSSNISEYQTNSNISSFDILTYTCKNNTFKGTPSGFAECIDCGTSKHWINFKADTTKNIVLKFKLTWNYDKLQFEE